MDESQDAERPSKNAPRYLPRVWKAQPEPEPEVPVKKKKAKKSDDGAEGRRAPEPRGKKPKKAKSEDDPDKPKSTLVEATPTFDAIEARQKARIIAGVVLAAIGLLFIFVIYAWVSGGKSEEEVSDDALLAQAPSRDPAQAEREAQYMFSRAREVIKRGNLNLTLAFLEKISRAYPLTPAAREATAALNVPRDGLAEFLEKSSLGTPTGPVPPKVAAGPAPPPAPTKPAQPPVTPGSATKPTAPAPPLATAPSGPTPPPPGGATAAAPLGPGPAGSAPPGSAPMPTGPVNPTNGLAVNSNEPPGKALPAGFRRSPNTTVSPSGWPAQIICDRDGATMVLVPGGNYRMGRDDGELSEAPAHRVVLSAYYIDQHEVTVRQFDVFQKQDGVRSERARALLKVPSTANDSEDAPATMVTAREAKDYATWAGKKLPTEAQWEIAARSGDGRLFPWGNEDPQWSKPREFRKVEPVLTHPEDVSPFGAFDMAGNAWEWTKDWYDVKYYNQFKNTTADNPTGPAKSKSEQLAVRGCAKNWSITKREGLKWSSRLPYVGFRCVLPVEGAGNAFEAPAAGGPAAPGAPNQGGVVPF